MEYFYTAFYGFGDAQNWLANLVLKKATGNQDASIVNFSVPFFLQPF